MLLWRVCVVWVFLMVLFVDCIYSALCVIVLGVGLLKPNISTMVGQLYERNDPKKDSAFTIFYMGINLGSFVAGLSVAWLAAEYGWQ